MLYKGENKTVLFKGNYHPAELYKGSIKTGGFEKVSFETDNSISLSDCYNDRIHNAVLIGNSIQDGVPTPEAPIEVQSVGELVTEGEHSGKYKVPITIRGKNLYKPLRISAQSTFLANYATSANNHGTSLSTTNATEEITVIQSVAPLPENINSYQNGLFCVELESGVLKVGEKYTLSFDCEILCSLLDTNGMSIIPNGGHGYHYFNAVNGRNSIDFTYETYAERDYYIEFRVSGKSLKISNLMITHIDSSDDYEPYIEPQTFNLYLNEPLRKLGEYADYIDFEKGVVVRKCALRYLKDFLQSTAEYDTHFCIVGRDDSILPNLNNSSSDVLVGYSNLFPVIQHWDYSINIDKVLLWNWGMNIRVTISKEHLPEASSEGLKQWLEENNPYMIRLLANPCEEQIELPVLPTGYGHTNIYELTGIVKPTLKGEYKKIIKE